MKVKITRPIRVNCLSGEVEVTQQEYESNREKEHIAVCAGHIAVCTVGAG